MALARSTVPSTTVVGTPFSSSVPVMTGVSMYSIVLSSRVVGSNSVLNWSFSTRSGSILAYFSSLGETAAHTSSPMMITFAVTGSTLTLPVTETFTVCGCSTSPSARVNCKRSRMTSSPFWIVMTKWNDWSAPIAVADDASSACASSAAVDGLGIPIATRATTRRQASHRGDREFPGTEPNVISLLPPNCAAVVDSRRRSSASGLAAPESVGVLVRPEGCVQPEVGVGPVQPPGRGALHPRVQLGADAADLALADPLHPQRPLKPRTHRHRRVSISESETGRKRSSPSGGGSTPRDDIIATIAGRKHVSSMFWRGVTKSVWILSFAERRWHHHVQPQA